MVTSTPSGRPSGVQTKFFSGTLASHCCDYFACCFCIEVSILFLRAEFGICATGARVSKQQAENAQQWLANVPGNNLVWTPDGRPEEALMLPYTLHGWNPSSKVRKLSGRAFFWRISTARRKYWRRHTARRRRHGALSEFVLTKSFIA